MSLRLLPCTSFFFPARDLAGVENLLQDWSVHEDIGVRQHQDGRLMLYALHGAASWPCEWTPSDPNESIDFDVLAMVNALAAGGQTVAVRTDEGEVVGMSLGGPAPRLP